MLTASWHGSYMGVLGVNAVRSTQYFYIEVANGFVFVNNCRLCNNPNY